MGARSPPSGKWMKPLRFRINSRAVLGIYAECSWPIHHTVGRPNALQANYYERSEKMTDEQKETYPVIPAKHWWTLRKRFQQSIPSTVTPGFLATALGMKELSAKANIIPSLVMMGIIDQEGKPRERAARWRDDVEYPEVCREIRNELYPQELLDAVPGPSVDRPAVERWFASRTGVGQAAAQRFTLVYELLTSATLAEKQETSARPAKPRSLVKPKARSSVSDELAAKEKEPLTLPGTVPSIHIDIQIHISPDAKPDQIDQIFASMAKHLRIGND